MAIEDPIILLGVAVGILVGLSVITLLYLERTKDQRIRNARRSKGLDSDNEAYNAVQSAKSISSIMKRKGRDTDEAEMVLERAEMALDSNNYSKAKSLAEEAKGKLQSATTASTTSMSASGTERGEESSKEKRDSTSGAKKKAYTEDDLDVLETEASESEEDSQRREEFKKQKEKIQSLPDNYLESRFEIRQARSKLEQSDDEGNEAAKKKLKSAREAFKSEDYAKALSLSIECKKKIGSVENEIIKGQKIGEQKEPDIPEGFEELETLGDSEQPQAQGITKTKETKETREQEKEPEQLEKEMGSGEMEKDMEEDMEDKLSELEELEQSEVVEEEVSVEREPDVEEELDEEMREEREEEVGEVQEKLICPDCGNEGQEGDKFCNKCGNELTVRLSCPGCGSEVKEDDKFCPKCGIELTPITYACPDCGAEIEREAQFCPQCGVEFE